MNTTLPQRFPPELITQYVKVIISPYVLTIPGKSTAVIRVTFTPPTGLEAKRIPVYSGYIYIQNSKKENFHLPYVGVSYDMKRVTLTDFENQFPYISNSSDTSENPKPIGANQTFIVSIDMPTINWRLVMSSPLVRVDILGSGKQINVAGMNILGSIPDYPLYWVSRNYFIKTNDNSLYYNVSWNGTLNTGIQVPAGTQFRASNIINETATARLDSKYFYNLWRPIVGIRQRASGNSADLNWLPLGAPENDASDSSTTEFSFYVSGHATFGLAIFEVLRRFYETDDIPFEFHSDEYNGKTMDSITRRARPARTRRYRSFTQAETENFLSRVYLGVHWRID
ncbi:unnamed protein product [Rotaria sp. Silwood1]|nr:unnamed protein product [Rotaria sp. Silwood1]